MTENTRKKTAPKNPGEVPCRHCTPPRRHSGCHSTCREHLAWKSAHDAYQRFVNKERCQSGLMTDYYMKRKPARHRKADSDNHI